MDEMTMTEAMAELASVGAAPKMWSKGPLRIYFTGGMLQEHRLGKIKCAEVWRAVHNLIASK